MDLLGYDFVQRGMAVGVILAVTSSLVGVFLVLRRMAFLGSSLSHAAFGGVALSFLLGLDPLIFTLVFSLVLANLVQALMTRSRRIPGDALLAIVFSGGASIAVIILGVADRFGEEIFGYLFGSILVASKTDLWITILVSAVALVFLALYYRRLTLITFSEEVAEVRGVRVSLVEHLLITVASLVIVLSVKTVGLILSSSLMVIPALSALLVAGSLKASLLIASLIGALSVVFGLILSLIYNLPPSGIIVGLMVLVFAVVVAVKYLKV